MATDHPDPIPIRPGLPQVLPVLHARAAARSAEPAGPAQRLRLPASACVVVLPDGPGPDDSQGPYWVALLALWLARDGLAVLVHRPGAPAARGGAADVLGSLGIAAVHDAAEVADRWARREPALLATARLDPVAAAAGGGWPLAVPLGPQRVLRIVPGGRVGIASERAGLAMRAGHALLQLDGPWPADARHGPGLAVWIAGARRPELGAAAFDEPLGCATPVPCGATATVAVAVQDVLSGALPVPAALQALAQRVTLAMRAIGGPLADDAVSCL